MHLLRSLCAEIQPFEQRRVIMSARPAAADNSRETLCFPGLLSRWTPSYLLSVCPTFRLDYSLEFDSFSTDSIFLHAAQFMFPFVWGKCIYRPTFDCPCKRYLTMIPCMLYGGDFQYDPVYAVWSGFSTELLRESTVHKLWAKKVLRESTVHRLIYVHESLRFSCVLPNIFGSSRRSLGRLLDVDNPSTFTTCRNRRHRRIL